MWRHLAVYASLLAMVAFAVLFSVFLFSENSLRLDEAQSLFQTNRDILGMLNLIAQDVHVPLYHVILHFWTLFLGQGVQVARLLSLLFFVGTILMTYVTAKYAFGRKWIGLVAALLVTLSPFMNWYGAEIRMYTMLAFFTVLHTYFFLKIMREGRSTHWILWTITAILGAYTHYFFLFVLLTELISVIFLRKYFVTNHPIRGVIIGGAITGLALLPWLYYVFTLGSASNTQPALTEPSAGDLFDTYAQFLFGFQSSAINTVIVSLWPIAVLLGFFTLQRSTKKIPPETKFFVALATVPVIAAFIVSIIIQPLFLSRYLIVALPALCIFLAWLLTRFRRPVAITTGSLLVVAMAGLFVIQIVNPNTPVKEDYREVVTYLEAETEPTDVIVLSAPFTIYPIEYYYDGSAKLTTQPVWDRFSSGSVPAYNPKTVAAETEQNVGSYQHAWLVLSYDQGYNDDLRTYYDTHYNRIQEKRFSPGLVVYEYKIRYDEPLHLNGSE